MRQEIHGARRYCKECPYYTRKANTLSMHVTRLHGNQDKHFCKECPDSFPTQTQLGHHIVNKHSEASISCANPLCTLIFKNSTTQKTHYVRCHLKQDLLYVRRPEKMCKCLSCGDIFTLNSVVYHVSGCSPLSPFCKNNNNNNVVAVQKEQQCLICPESFPTHAQLSHHIVAQHPNIPLPCVHTDCDLTFKNSKAQKKHYVRRHMDKPLLYSKIGDNSCKCISCENVFTDSTIVYHVASCSNLSPFCDNNTLCHFIQPEEEMVLNQAEEFLQNLPDVEPGELDEIVRQSGAFDDLEDIPDDFLDELNQMLA